ncbi:unnamed protein product [Sphenostylis stenocarpa]|uniref:AB hydrolase-1 domain-containing protein n=1 Tax=Sphenostylis stenocarpa TaxID=92480 RepID=A0AA86VSM4_9FABA|nr:unnamed protein product [Sphenostylis stenocarpa]
MVKPKKVELHVCHMKRQSAFVASQFELMSCWAAITSYSPHCSSLNFQKQTSDPSKITTPQKLHNVLVCYPRPSSSSPSQLSLSSSHSIHQIHQPTVSMLPKLSKCFSFTASRDWLYRHLFASAGLRSVATDLGEGTTMHCWVPKLPKPCKPSLVLVHGFGANAMWQYGEHVRHFTGNFNVYVPDLVFFGESFTSRSERSESFQAKCLVKMMEAHGVQRMSLVGISYGGFVGYSVGAQFPEVVEKLVLCCAGVCLEEVDMANGLFRVSSLDEASNILLPQTPDKLRELMKLSFVRPARGVPTWFLQDFIEVMCTDYIEEKRELLESILKGRQLSDLPKIQLPTLIIWGEQDQIFPLELGHRLKGHIGENSQMVVIKNAGHAVNLEKPKEFGKHLKAFLIDNNITKSCPTSPLGSEENIHF